MPQAQDTDSFMDLNCGPQERGFYPVDMPLAHIDGLGVHQDLLTEYQQPLAQVREQEQQDLH